MTPPSGWPGPVAEGATGPLLADLLTRCTFPPPGTELACAVSGGPDSLALLLLAAEAGCAGHRLPRGPRAATRIRRRRPRWWPRLAADLGAGFEAWTVAVAPGPNLEARARAARFAALPAGVATGHTMDDQAETVLLHVLRGAAADGLAGMAPGLRHPLLALRRAETHCAVPGRRPRAGARPEQRGRRLHPQPGPPRAPPALRRGGRARPGAAAGPPGRPAARRGGDCSRPWPRPPCPTPPTPGPWPPPTRSWPGVPCGPGCAPQRAGGTRPRWPRWSAPWPWPGARRVGTELAGGHRVRRPGRPPPGRAGRLGEHRY